MKMSVYSIFDRKALVYHQPYFALNHAVAVRTLSDAVADPNSMFGRHPNDYVLYCIGQYDDSKGSMESSSPLEHVIDAIALVKAVQSEIPFPDRATTTRPSEVERELFRAANGHEMEVK